MASKEKQVLIPQSVFQDLLELLKWLSGNDAHLILDLELELKMLTALQVLREKEEKAELRKAYTNILFAKNDESRHFARMNYLTQKRSVHGNPYTK